ncbi:MAG: hypothetical protein D6794_12620, partial [Deltaproteobacteria bacterium]
MRVILRLQRFAWDVGGVFLTATGLLTLLGLLPSATGSLLLAWGDFLYHWMGWGAWTLPPALVWCGLWMLVQPVHERPFPWRRMVAWESAAVSLLVLLSLWHGASLVRADGGLDGGIIGWGIAQAFLLLLPLPAAFLLSAMLVGMGMLTGMGWGTRLIRGLRTRLERAATPEEQREAPVSVAPAEGGRAAPPAAARRKRKAASLPPEFRKNFRVQTSDDRPVAPVERDAQLPPLNLLDSQRAFRPDERHINQTAGLIEKTLAEFGVPARVVGFQVGPTITQFALEP